MTWPDYSGTTLSVAKNLRTDQVASERSETSVDRDFVRPHERDLQSGQDFTILYVLFAGLVMVGVVLAWLAGLWHF